MIHQIQFTKTSGAGNDFVVIDNREGLLPVDTPELARCLCSRHFGVGGDGLLLIEESARAHFTMKYYNADGSFGGMCGNGGRCIARIAFQTGIAPAEMSFEVLDAMYHAEILSRTVRLMMKDPSALKDDVKVYVGDEVHRGYFINTGSPHFVEFVENVEAIDVHRIGLSIRGNPAFSPEGTNVNFVEVMGNNNVRLRTYERGVEGETLACGTGAVAAGIISHVFKETLLPVTVHVASGETLNVDASLDSDRIVSPTLEGSAHILFSGKLQYDDSTNAIVHCTSTDCTSTD